MAAFIHLSPHTSMMLQKVPIAGGSQTCPWGSASLTECKHPVTAAAMPQELPAPSPYALVLCGVCKGTQTASPEPQVLLVALARTQPLAAGSPHPDGAKANISDSEWHCSPALPRLITAISALRHGAITLHCALWPQRSQESMWHLPAAGHHGSTGEVGSCQGTALYAQVCKGPLVPQSMSWA